MRGNTVTIEVSLKRGKMAKSVPLYQYDYGQKLIFTNVELPSAYEVHFSNELHGDSVTMIGDSTGVLIPDSLLTTGLPVYLWAFLHTDTDDGETEYTGVIPVIQRAQPSDVTPTPEEQSAITQAIAALNAGVETVENAVETIDTTIQASLQEAKESGLFDGADGQDGQDGQDGFTPTVDITSISGGYQMTITNSTGASVVNVMNGVDGSPGADGSDGADGQDGADGADGEDGFSPVATVTKDGTVATISITDSTGTTTATISDGEKGDTGETGATPSFSIGTVTTGDPGTDADVTMSGTQEEPVLNFLIPQGADGDATVDDTAGAGDTTHVWSANKTNKEISDLKTALTTVDQYFYAKRGAWNGSRIVAANNVAHVMDVPLIRYRKFQFHYPSTLKFYSLWKKVNGTWSSVTGITDDTFEADNTVENFIVQFVNKTSSSIDITDDELSKIYLSIIDTDFENLEKRLTTAENDINTVTPLIVNYPNIQKYFYKDNIYINNSGDETALDGYDTYKIPCKANQIIRISWDNLSETPWNGIDVSYAWKIFKSDNSFIQIKAQASNNGYILTTNKECIAICPANAVYSTLTVKHGNETGVSLQIDIPYETVSAYDKISIDNVVHTINESNAIRTQYFFNSSTQTFSSLGSTAKALMFHVYSGDVIDFTTIRSGLSSRGSFRADDGTMVNIGTVIESPFTYTAESDGVVCVYYLASEIGDAVYKPKDQIKIEAKNVIGLSDGTQFDGLSGVAFGTSLTYNASIGNGYLTRLSTLSGITFDNQGVGSSTILGDGGSLDMLAKIKAYTGYSGKRVCLLEGFVNDWYGQNQLGTWQDNTETTVCGCVRSALNYMLTQNANMTVFLILDHYGRSYNTLDCSSTVKRNNLTQFEYYTEIAKVAKSLGVPVIKEFGLSGISELMPQYLADNIHLNALGAIQSANAIWYEMKLHPLNAS